MSFLLTGNTRILLDLELPISKNSKEIEVVALKPDAGSLSATHIIKIILALSRLLLNLLYGEIEQEPDQCHQNASRQWFAENEIHYFKAWGQSLVIGDFPRLK